MPFVAVCPHCREARFRAPSKKRGTFQSCPKCGQDFLLTPEGLDHGPVPYRSLPFDDLDRQPSMADVALIDDPVPTAPELAMDTAPVTAIPEPSATPVEFPPPAVGVTQIDIPQRFAMVALALFGAAMVASQFPYGRFVAAGLGGIGAVIGFLALLGLEKKAWLGWAAGGLNVFGLLLVLAFPDWLGVTSWTPVGDPDTGPKPVTAFGRDGTLPTPTDRVDAAAAVWEQGDVRIVLASIQYVPVARGKKERNLQIGLKLVNVGVSRAVPFTGWTTPPPDEPKLTTAGGVVLPVRAVTSETVQVLPGKWIETTVTFAGPTGPTGDLNLDLPASAIGGPDPVKFRIPARMVPR